MYILYIHTYIHTYIHISICLHTIASSLSQRPTKLLIMINDSVFRILVLVSFATLFEKGLLILLHTHFCIYIYTFVMYLYIHIHLLKIYGFLSSYCHLFWRVFVGFCCLYWLAVRCCCFSGAVNLQQTHNFLKPIAHYKSCCVLHLLGLFAHCFGIKDTHTYI